jgi:hypothetical protein
LSLDFDRDIAAFAAGGDNIMGVVLTPDGGVWTWGNVLGEHRQSDFWGPKGKENHPKFTVRMEPWRLSISD